MKNDVVNSIALIAAAILGCVLLIAFIGRKPPGRDLTESAVTTEDTGEGPITNHAGQTVVYVEAGKATSWLSKHRDVRIVCMAGYVRANFTNGYYIIYESLATENK